jgi:hypothetical protein
MPSYLLGRAIPSLNTILISRQSGISSATNHDRVAYRSVIC